MAVLIRTNAKSARTIRTVDVALPLCPCVLRCIHLPLVTCPFDGVGWGASGGAGADALWAPLAHGNDAGPPLVWVYRICINLCLAVVVSEYVDGAPSRMYPTLCLPAAKLFRDDIPHCGLDAVSIQGSVRTKIIGLPAPTGREGGREGDALALQHLYLYL